MNANTIETTLTVEALKQSIKTLEESKLTLLVTIKELKDKLEQQKNDQADIYYFLNKKCDESFEIIATLEEQLLNEQADREISEKLYEAKIEELRINNTISEAKYQTKISEMEKKLDLLGHFAESKDETERVMKDLMNRLEEEQIQFQSNADTMENRFLLEREKLRKSYDIKYESLKRELESSIDGKLAKKTQRTQIMNVIMKKELDTQSRHAERLIEINERLMQRENELSRELDLAKGIQHETMLKLQASSKKIKRLEEEMEVKCHDMDLEKQKYSMEVNNKSKAIAQLSIKAKQATDQLQKSFAETDELWIFLKSCFVRYFPTRNVEGIELQSKDPHESLLVKLIQEAALKYPDFLTKYVKVGLDIQERSKAGIYSWDKNKRSSSTLMMSNKAIQTENPDLSNSKSSWLRTNSDDFEHVPISAGVYHHPSRSYRLISSGSENQDNASISAFSVPSIIGKANRSLLPLPPHGTQDFLDSDTIKSQNSLSAVSAPPQKKKRHMKKSSFLSVTEINKSLEDKNSVMRKLTLSASFMKGEGSIQCSDKRENSADALGIDGRKFVAPMLLPKLK